MFGLRKKAPQSEQQASTDAAMAMESAAISSGQSHGAEAGLEKHYVHHSYVWLGSIRIVAIVLFTVVISMGSSFIGLFLDGTMESPDDARIALIIMALCAVAVLLVLVAIVVYQIVSYKHLWYELGESEFNFYKGILSKKRVHIPYQRIQSVDQRMSLLQRIFGVCSVSIDTAGGSANKATLIPYLAKQDAELLRRELFARKQYALAGGNATGAMQGFLEAQGSQTGNVLDVPAGFWDEVGGIFAGQAVDTGAVSYEYGLTNKELILTGLSNGTTFALILLGVLGVVSQFAGGLFDFAPASADVVGHMIAAGSAWAVGTAVAAGAAMLFGAALLVWALSALGTCVSYGGFKARRRGGRIEVEHGLLQHQFQGVDVDRVQSVTIRQSLIRRALGCCEISLGKIETASTGDDGSTQSSLAHGLVIHPFVKVSRVPEILAGIIPEYADVPYEAIQLPRVALRRGIIRRCVLQGFGFWLAVITALTQIMLNLAASLTGDADLAFALPYINGAAVVCYVFAILLAVVDAVGAVLWFRESSFAYNHGFMQLTLGGLSRETTSFPRGKIQFGYTRVNPFQKRAGTRTVCVRTAAGIGGTTMRLIDVSESDAIDWLEWVKPRSKKA